MRPFCFCLTVLLAGATLLVAPPPAGGDSIISSKHNLSVSGPGPVRALKETRVCVFCHTPHTSVPGTYLWNRDVSPVTYNLYASSSFTASARQPSGVSKLCLSCHDGTVALGLVRSKKTPIAMVAGAYVMPEGRTRLGLDLSDDHPISFPYDSFLVSKNMELVSPSSLRMGRVSLDKSRQVQCTSCHDPHNDRYGKFLVMDNTYSALCVTCHRMADWNSSSHATSSSRWNGSPPNPWPNAKYARVDMNGCENCHTPHSAGRPDRLLTGPTEEDTCLVCHNGNVARENIKAEILKYSPGLSGAVARYVTRAGNTETAYGHTKCSACHNPHATADRPAVAPIVSGPLRRVSGLSPSGPLSSNISEAQYQYQICYKCHADGVDVSSPTVPRQIPQENVRLQFSPSNLSFHPVESSGRNPDVPSLLSPYNAGSYIYCTDCHNNDNLQGPQGPHGSNYAPLLERPLVTQDRSQESPSAYALCYKCHDRQSILADQSFKYHSKHIREENTPCSVCHDPHGVSSQAHLINFDLRAVSPSGGTIRFEDLGNRAGRCYLKCHNKDHSPKEYR